MTYIKSKRELKEEELKEYTTHQHFAHLFVRKLIEVNPNLKSRGNFNFIDIVEKGFWSFIKKPVVDVYLQWEYNNSIGIHVYKEEYFKSVKKIVEELGNDNTIWIEYE